MKAPKLPLVTILTTTLIAGCGTANNTHFYKSLNVSDGQGALVDVKQRAIFVHKKTAPNGADLLKVCAEPSPDAISTFASQLAASAEIDDKGKASLARAFQESGAFVGTRTHSIQLLRDSLYRVCEAYMSDAIDASTYQLLLRRYQRSMIGLLAIEQLTGVVRSPTVIITNSGTASTGGDFAALYAELGEVQGQIASKTEEKNTKAKEAESLTKGSDELTTAQAEIETLTKEIGELETKAKALDEKIKQTTGLSASGASKFSILQNHSAETAQDVTEAVKYIFKTLADVNDLPALCWSALSSKANPETDHYKFCKTSLVAVANSTVAAASLATLKANIIKRLSDLKISDKDYKKKKDHLEQVLNKIESRELEIDWDQLKLNSFKDLKLPEITP